MFRTILVPIMTRPNFIWSNIWGDVDSNGYYARSDDYLDIVENKKKLERENFFKNFFIHKFFFKLIN
jgi:hypothetical protein